MLAPTPVSALVHSSTLVTAGVYLLYRFAPLPSYFVLFIGLLTTLLSGLAALFECDIKKIIALSTLSQLGIIVTSLGCGERSLSFFHLNTHAAFKALLFLAVGSIIHTYYGSQEVRSSLFLPTSSPYLLVILVLSSSSLCGLVFMSGWGTKEAILEAIFSENSRLFCLFLFYVGIVLTVLYRFRLLRSLLGGSVSVVCSPTFLARSNLIQEPMNWLVCCSLVQGAVFSMNTKLCLTFLSYSDKVFVLLVCCLSLLLGGMLDRVRPLPTLPLTSLKLITTYLSRSCSGSSSLLHTENSIVHGAGLGMLPSLLLPITLGGHVLPKLFCSLAAVFILV